MANKRPLVLVASTGNLQQLSTGDFVDPVSLGAGTPGSNNILRGDGQWATVAMSPAGGSAFDPNHKNAGITLSNSNQTATFTATQQTVLGATGVSSGKYYMEVTFVSGTSSANCAAGVAPQNEPLSGAQLGYNDAVTGSVGIFQTSGNIYKNGSSSSVGSSSAWGTAGNVLCIAVDATARLIWFRTGAGNWNNNASNNPATGVGGIAISGTAAIFPALGSDKASVFTANFGASAFNQAAPSGFSAWNTAASAAVTVSPTDVNIVAVAAGDLLQFNGSQWANTPIAAAIAAFLNGDGNKFTNGSMEVDQRNNGNAQTITAGAALAYTIDRWYAYCTGANVTGQQVAGSGTTRKRYQFTGAASVTGIGFGQRIAAANAYDLNGGTATLSVDLANSLLTTVSWTAYYANTADTFGTLASPTRTQIATGTFTVNSTVARYSTQIAIPAAATTGIEVVFSVGAQTSGTWTIGKAKLEAGSNATPLVPRPFEQELLICQRYFWTNYDGVAVGTATTAGALVCVSTNGSSAGGAFGSWTFPVAMRIAPAVTFYSSDGTVGYWRSGGASNVAVGNAGVSPNPRSFVVNNSGAAIAQGTAFYGFVAANAEL